MSPYREGVQEEVRLLRGVLVAVVEVLAVVVLGWLTWWCWQRGVIIPEHDDVTLRRIEGRWWAVATGAATLAGILMLDALRQVMPLVHPRAPASVRG
jgi:hypothetical protein